MLMLCQPLTPFQQPFDNPLTNLEQYLKQSSKYGLIVGKNLLWIFDEYLSILNRLDHIEKQNRRRI